MNKKEIYNAVYRIFDEANRSLVIKVGDKEISLHTPDEEDYSIWEFGVSVNGEVLNFDDLYANGLGPGTYAELFSGKYDVIDGFAELICKE